MNLKHLLEISISSKAYLRQQVMQGAIERYGNTFVDSPAFINRVETELQTICTKEDTVIYLLIVADLVHAAHEMGIMVGPGRSSVAGSLVAYCLKITNIDPLKYGLLFERYYSDTHLLPNIDIDVEEGERDKVLEYISLKYGETGPWKTHIVELTVLRMIKRCLNDLKQVHGINLDINSIPKDDEQTFKLFQEGRTSDIFQFQSEDMQKYLRELVPNSFEELVAINAMYRPGPMDNIPHYIARKHGMEPIQYEIPVMETFLKETYGIIVYQEQVMSLSREIANFTPTESKALCCGKKPIIETELRDKFITGGIKNGYTEDKLNKVWTLITTNPWYKFLKAHAVCYTWLGYQEAYLKAHYPVEFMDAYAAVWERDVDC